MEDQKNENRLPENFHLQRRIYLNEDMLSEIFWNALFKSDSSRALDRKLTECHRFVRDFAVQHGQTEDGTLSLNEMGLLYLLSKYFRPRIAIEIGTFIGSSTWSIFTGGRETIERIYTCDAVVKKFPERETLEGKITFTNEISTALLQRCRENNIKADFIFIDAALSSSDPLIISQIITEDAVILIDDFDGTEKGTLNAISLRQILRNYLLLRPTTISGVKYKMAVLVPQQLLAIHPQLYAPSYFCNDF